MQIAGNADAVVVAGTTEKVTLTDDEHIELVRHAVKYVNGRIPVIAGAGSNNTAHAVYLSKECEKAGADALLHVTPYYNKARDYFILQMRRFNRSAHYLILSAIPYRSEHLSGHL